MAQRGLIVRELYLPQAKEEAAKRLAEGRSRGGGDHSERSSAEMRSSAEGLEPAKAAQIAAQEANGLASARTIETVAPVDDAPETQERIRSGKIKTAAQARREALKEIGSDEPTDVGKTKPMTAYRNLGACLGKADDTIESIERDDIGK